MYLIRNAIRTPDQTILRSYHRHDFVSHKDENGETYMVDGGISYIRRSINHIKAEDLSLYYDPEMPDEYHEDNVVGFLGAREVFLWGTRGPKGDQPLKRVRLSGLHTDHIEAILSTQSHIPEWMRDLFKQELEYRNWQK